MNAPLLLGIDPGFATCGIALVALDKDGERVLRLEVVRTKKSPKKRDVRASEDNVRRIIEIANRVMDVSGEGVIGICSESQSWPRNSGTSAKLGMVWGVIGTLSVMRGAPVLQATPMEIKKRLCGRGTASKKEVQAALVQRYGALDLPDPAGVHEHACDALAAVVACLDAPSVLMARRML